MIKHVEWYTIKVNKSNESHYKFKIYEIYFKNEEGIHYKSGRYSTEPTQDIEEADPIGTGTIKFDGCSNWDFRPDDVLLHLCGENKLDEFYRVLKECYNIADEITTI